MPARSLAVPGRRLPAGVSCPPAKKREGVQGDGTAPGNDRGAKRIRGRGARSAGRGGDSGPPLTGGGWRDEGATGRGGVSAIPLPKYWGLGGCPGIPGTPKSYRGVWFGRGAYPPPYTRDYSRRDGRKLGGIPPRSPAKARRHASRPVSGARGASNLPGDRMTSESTESTESTDSSWAVDSSWVTSSRCESAGGARRALAATKVSGLPPGRARMNMASPPCASRSGEAIPRRAEPLWRARRGAEPSPPPPTLPARSAAGSVYPRGPRKRRHGGGYRGLG